MIVKFLIPELNRAKWSKIFSDLITKHNLKSKQLNNASAEIFSASIINNYKYYQEFASLDRLLCLCRFFNLPIEQIISPTCKWVQTEVDDISHLVCIGKIKSTYYVTPRFSNYIPAIKYHKFDENIEELSSEPSPSIFENFTLKANNYSENEKIENRKLIYRYVSVDINKTFDNIEKLLKEHNISSKKVEVLLDLCYESVRRRKKRKQPWTFRDIYKLSWIFNKPFEEIVVLNYSDYTADSIYNFPFAEYFTDAQLKQKSILFTYTEEIETEAFNNQFPDIDKI